MLRRPRARLRGSVRTLLLAAAAVAGLVTVPAMSATAITGGTPDGEGHPNVAVILFYDKADHLRYRCTATLVTPTVLVTAAHCTADTVGKTIVSFSSTIAEAPPSGIPTAPDAAADGSSQTGYTQSGAYHRLARPHVVLRHAGRPPAVLRLHRPQELERRRRRRARRPVTGITPATIAPAGYLDTDPEVAARAHALHDRRLRHRGPQAAQRPAEAGADVLPADPPRRRGPGSEADAADPPGQRQLQRHARHRWLVLR